MVGCKIMSKQLHVTVTTIANILTKYKVHGTAVNLLWCGNGKKLSKTIQAELQGQHTSLFDHTIHHILNYTWSPLLTEKKHKSKMHVDKPQSPLDWSHKTGAFWPLRSVLCLQVEKWHFKENNTTPLLKKKRGGGGWGLFWGCFTASGTVNCQGYQGEKYCNGIMVQNKKRNS